jgi:hypothetical protein
MDKQNMVKKKMKTQERNKKQENKMMKKQKRVKKKTKTQERNRRSINRRGSRR